MADKDIKISIKTTADTSGVDKADASVKKLNGTVSVGSVQGFLDSTADKAKAAEFAFYDLDAAVGKASTTNQTYTAGQSQVQQSTRNSSAALLMFSQGLEDAQYGIRGVLNNIPGLVMSLGASGGVAGAISIAAVSFSMLFDWLGKTGEEASKSKDEVNQLAEDIGKLTTDKLQKTKEVIDAASTAAVTLRQQFTETKNAEDEYATATLSNAAQVAIAEQNINTLLGQRVSHLQTIARIAAEEEKQRVNAAQQAIAAENEKLEAARTKEQDAQDRLDRYKKQAEDEKNKLEIERQRLSAFEAAMRAAKKGSEAPSVPAPSPFLPNGGMGFAPNPIDQDAGSNVAAAKAEYENLKQVVEAQEKKVNALVSSLNALNSDDVGTIAKLEVAVGEAANKREDLESAVETSTRQIKETLASAQLRSKSDELVKIGEEAASEIQKVFTDVKTTTAAGEDARKALLKAASDGQITANEISTVSQSLMILTGQLQAGLAGSSENTSKLIEIATSLQLTVTTQGRQIQELQKAQIQTARDATR